MFAYLEGSAVGGELEDKSTSLLATPHTEELVLMTKLSVLSLQNCQ